MQCPRSKTEVQKNKAACTKPSQMCGAQTLPDVWCPDPPRCVVPRPSRWVGPRPSRCVVPRPSQMYGAQTLPDVWCPDPPRCVPRPPDMCAQTLPDVWCPDPPDVVQLPSIMSYHISLFPYLRSLMLVGEAGFLQ